MVPGSDWAMLRVSLANREFLEHCAAPKCWIHSGFLSFSQLLITYCMLLKQTFSIDPYCTLLKCGIVRVTTSLGLHGASILTKLLVLDWQVWFGRLKEIDSNSGRKRIGRGALDSPCTLHDLEAAPTPQKAASPEYPSKIYGPGDVPCFDVCCGHTFVGVQIQILDWTLKAFICKSL